MSKINKIFLQVRSFIVRVCNKCSKKVWVCIAIFFVMACLCLGLWRVILGGHTSSSDGTRVIYSLDSRQNDQEIIRLVDGAEKYVYFAVYYFSQKNIAEALLRARQRGLVVQGIVDREGAKQASNASVLKLLQSGGVSVITQKHLDGIMHMKAIVTDKSYASGSYNWTAAATEANDEVLEIGNDDRIRNEFLDIVKRVIANNTSSNDLSSGANSKPNVIDYTDASKHVGEYAEVRGSILKAYKSASGTVFLDFCKSSSKCPFSALIFASDSNKFTDVNKYVGNVSIAGIIRAYRGSAEIVINDPTQITMK